MSLESKNFSEFEKYVCGLSSEQLLKIKEQLDDIYYNTGESKLPDVRYDYIKDLIIEKINDYKPSIGSKLREGENRVNLPFWLGSADKISPNDIDKLNKWIEKNNSTSYIITEKLDGVSCLLVIKDKKTYLYTRGDGEVGADISYIVPYLNIPIKEDINVRGELIIQKSVFDSKYRDKKYKNPRNMVSGLINSKTSREGLTDVNLVCYEIVNDNMYELEKQLKNLKKYGFRTAKHERINELDIDLLKTKFLEYKSTSNYELDGIIINSNRYYDRNTNGNPEYMFAFKMLLENDIHTTTVNCVEWNVSKWGQLKPTLVVEPVKLNDITISRATAHNAKYIFDNNLGKGSIINITRSKDVIPYVVEIIKCSEKPDMPNIKYVWDKNNVNISVVDEEDDTTIRVKLISGFFEKVGIKQISEGTVQKLFDNGFTTLLSIIKASKEDLKKVPTIKDKSAERIVKNIKEGLNSVKIPTVLGASGIFGFGIGIKRLETLFLYIPDILTLYKNNSDDVILNKILNVEGFSDIMASKIVENLKDADKFIRILSQYATFESCKKVSDTMLGHKYAMTGFRDKDLEETIISRGGKVVNSVSKNTNALIVLSLEKCKDSSKLTNAKKCGIKIYELEKFKELFN